jgi:hypothetical protein
MLGHWRKNKATIRKRQQTVGFSCCTPKSQLFLWLLGGHHTNYFAVVICLLLLLLVLDKGLQRRHIDPIAVFSFCD